MKVRYNEIQRVYCGRYERQNIPIFERKVIDEGIGEIVGSYLGKDVDSLGKPFDAPAFILLLEDGRFISVPISECKLLKEVEK